MTGLGLLLSKIRPWRTYGIYGAVCVAVLLPLLFPGYILTLDMVFTPQIPMPQHLTSSYVFYFLLHTANSVVPSMVLQKAILVSILLLSMVGMHWLVQTVYARLSTPNTWHIHIAAILYAINPFTYSRFMAGQFAVLLGYALLPWFMWLGIRLWQQPTTKRAIALGLLTAVIGVVSIHTLGLVAVLCCAAFASLLIHRRLTNIGRWLTYGGTAFATFCVTSSYWLIPLLAGKGKTANAIGNFTTSDITAFATNGDNVVEKIIYIAQLRGFWAEARGLFLLPPDIFPAWGLAIIFFWALVAIGLVQLWRHSKQLATYICLAITIATFLAVGVPLESLREHIPIIMGLREPHKFVGIIALCFCLCIARGIPYVLTRLERANKALYTVAAVAILLLPYLTTPTMAFGFSGQLRPRHYPPDWLAINQQLNADPDTFTVLFLPWHQYMSYRFAGRIIANPAEHFFDKPMIVSTDPELKGAAALNTSPRQKQLDKLLANAHQTTTLGLELKKHNIKYVLLAKDLDYRDYRYLDSQQDLSLLTETEHLKLYRNQAWSKP